MDVAQALAYLETDTVPAPTPRIDTSTTVIVTLDQLASGDGLAPGGRYRLDRFGMLNAGFGTATFAFDVAPRTSSTPGLTAPASC